MPAITNQTRISVDQDSNWTKIFLIIKLSLSNEVKLHNYCGVGGNEAADKISKAEQFWHRLSLK